MNKPTIVEMRNSLSRFCQGKERMCVPAREDDDDMVLSAAIDELEQLRVEVEDWTDKAIMWSKVADGFSVRLSQALEALEYYTTHPISGLKAREALQSIKGEQS